MRLLLLVALSCLSGCALIPPSAEEAAYDPDGDGVPWPEDCDSGDAQRYPGAPEIWYDGIDQDCGVDDDFDQDGDGWVPGDYAGMVTQGVAGSGGLPGGDCWDEPTGPADSGLAGIDINPGADEVWYDGVDQDCDGQSDFDADGDGYDHLDYEGEDCDDDDASISPAAAEIWYDGIDQDCDGDDCDQDGDGLDADPDGLGFCEQLDCDDTDPDVGGSSTEERWYDGVDQDCDGNDGDQDGDGYWVDDYLARVAAAGGTPLAIPGGAEGDCWDVPMAVGGLPADFVALGDFPQVDADQAFPGAGDTWYDGIDQDCGDDDDFDQDGDGRASDAVENRDGFTGSDCDDTDPGITPDAIESWYDGVDDNCDANDGDQDGDGYWVADYDSRVLASGGTPLSVPSGYEGDCDDLDPWMWPGAPEYCDGIDSDCDGTTDDDDALDISTWYQDADTDGWGDPAVVALACTQPSGFVTDGSDCDDADAAINPGMPEICDGLDDDCDGLVDHLDPDIGDAVSWYPDLDGDAWGNAAAPGSPYCLGSEPEGWLVDGSDCDDSDAAQHPGADERCNGEDDDCDGISDEDDAVDALTWYADADADGYGDVAVSADACVGPAGWVLLAWATDCDDEDAAVNPGATEVVADGLDSDCDAMELCYQDADVDGYGGVSTVASVDLSCTDPGESSVGTDCDDGLAAVNPGATELVADGVDNDCDGIEQCYVDGDGDGFGLTSTVGSADLDCADTGEASSTTDCDDTDAAVHPGATEQPGDAVDSDCDGIELCYQDADADGWGSSVTVGSGDVACASGGLSPTDGDCDDWAATIFPGATEVVADGVDQDCDGLEACYADADLDRFGSSTLVASADLDCDDSGEARNSDDCDDSDIFVSPGATERPVDGVDNDCDGLELCYLDTDGDGFGSTSTLASYDTDCTDAGEAVVSTDCDDADAAAYPGASERCDGHDDDCDGLVDEDDAVDVATWYLDADADGFGDATISSQHCDAPAGWVADATDCDDGDAGISPAASEYVADGVDADCDGAELCYRDSDGDGFGSVAVTTSADQDCDDAGEAWDSSDCDDGFASRYPGAAERCNGADDDCDGVIDEADAVDAPTWYLDADADGYGDGGTSIVDCVEPSGYAAAGLGEDCDDADSGVHPGAEERCDGHDDDCDGLLDEDDAVDALTWYRDLDADGYGDAASTRDACSQPSGYVAVSTDCDDDSAAVNPSASEICNNGVDDDCDGEAPGCTPLGDIGLAEADAILLGEVAGDGAGVGVAMVGDLDGDGLDDLVVSASGNDDAGFNTGSVYLVLGPVSGEAGLGSWQQVTGEAVGDAAGTRVASAFDVDGDGLGDLLIGAPANDTNGGSAGAAYLLLGPASGVASLASADARLLGEDSGDQAATGLAGAGDVDGDGLGELWVGAVGQDRAASNAGAAYLVSTPVSGDFELLYATAMLLGEAANDTAGSALAGGHDIDGDGLDDALVGAPGYDAGGSDRGVAYLWLGPIAGTLSLASADARLLGVSDGDGAGASLSLIDDVDGDGLDDLLVGAPNASPGGSSQAGVVYLALSAPSGDISLADLDAQILGEAAYDALGSAVAGAGDVNGDGLGDWALGARDASVAASDAGAVYLFLGAVSGQLLATEADSRLLGVAASDEAGSALGGPGDADGDGYDDLLVGAAGYDGAGAGAGAAFLLRGGGF